MCEVSAILLCSTSPLLVEEGGGIEGILNILFEGRLGVELISIESTAMPH